MPDDRGTDLVPRHASDEARPTPNLFIVGAPKSGTTALASYLGSHPEVFVADKELSYFGSDLEFRTTKGGRWRIGYDTYLEWFGRHGNARYRTDRSVFYLYSSRAAAEINAFDPGSRAIALLRNPVDQMHSQHSEMLFQGDEDMASFAQAIAAEDDRRRGVQVPPGCQKVFGLLYRDIALYGGQVERYITEMGRHRVHVVLYDDLVADAPGAYRRVLEFLDIDPGHRPEFAVVNANKVVRSPRVRDLLRHAPPGLRRMGRLVVPDEFARAALRRRLHGLNTRGRARPPMAPALRRQLTDELAPDIHRLETLLDRDLGAWLTPGDEGSARGARQPGVDADGRAR
ncbi:MAG TPA: sulfotransferase [Acidimicrobiales bacterium]